MAAIQYGMFLKLSTTLASNPAFPRILWTQFINTGLLFLLVYGTAPTGYETPQVLKDLSIFAGSYNDFSRDWQVSTNGGTLVFTYGT